MSKPFHSHFLTLVLILIASTSIAAPPPTGPELDEPPKVIESHDEIEIPRDISDIILFTPFIEVDRSLQPQQTQYFFPYRRELSPHLGVSYDKKYFAEKSLLYTAGFTYQFPLDILTTLEAGADVFSAGFGRFHISRIWTFSKTTQRPFTRAGMSVLAHPEQAMATFLKIENYQMILGYGREYLTKPPLSIRVEGELTISTNTIALMMLFGYSWSW